MAVVTAGTSDLPVAEEARETLLWMGVEVTMIFDVGVAGPHRLREHLSQFERADARGRDRRHGRRAAQRRRRLRCLPGDRRADQRRLRRELGRHRGAAEHAQQLRGERDGREHRRRIQGGYIAGLIAARAARRDASSTGGEPDTRVGLLP